MSTDPMSLGAPDFKTAVKTGEKRAPVNFDSAAKFLFDLSFDSDAPPRVEAPPPITLPADELEQIKRAMYEDGRAAGRAEAVQAGADEAAAQLAYLASQLQQLAADGQSRAGTETDVIADAIKAIAQNLLPAYVSRHGAGELDAIVRDCLVQLKGEPRLVIRTAESELDASINRFEGLAQASAFQGKLIILADGALNPGDLRVEWADGGLERATGNLWTEVEKILSRSMQNHGGAAPQQANAYMKPNEPNGDLNG